VTSRALVFASFVLGCSATGSDNVRAVPNYDAAIDVPVPGSDTEFAVDADETEPVDTGSVTVDAACASSISEAKVEVLPVDIIWMVDNSASMEPAVKELKAGLNAFASLISAKKLDFKVIMLSLRSKTSPISVAGSTRYPICIPPPLAGDDNCGNGPRFFHSHVDIKSTQPLEQFLGTLDQTEGYKVGQERGAEPWKAQLRPSATRTIVVVTDDNARLSATDFETFAGGKNPFNSLTLPVGVLDTSRTGMFADYVFAGIYGWGSESDPSVKCKFSDGTFPASSGSTYTTLVKKTGGPRAKLCEGKAAWTPFFDAVASAVARAAKLACEVALPIPASGTLDPTAVNVEITSGTTTTLVPKVVGASACGTSIGWYYDNDATPTKVMLCPAACDLANASVGVDKGGRIDVLFGCKTVIK
jgi:hypothetical protein